MPQVSVTIDGRKYRLACNEGEEARLESLAGLIDEKIGEMLFPENESYRKPTMRRSNVQVKNATA